MPQEDSGSCPCGDSGCLFLDHLAFITGIRMPGGGRGAALMFARGNCPKGTNVARVRSERSALVLLVLTRSLNSTPPRRSRIKGEVLGDNAGQEHFTQHLGNARWIEPSSFTHTCTLMHTYAQTGMAKGLASGGRGFREAWSSTSDSACRGSRSSQPSLLGLLCFPEGPRIRDGGGGCTKSSWL